MQQHRGSGQQQEEAPRQARGSRASSFDFCVEPQKHNGNGTMAVVLLSNVLPGVGRPLPLQL